MLRLLDELAEAFDGLLVGAEVVAVEGLLGAPVLLGLLLENPRQCRRGRLWWERWLARCREPGHPKPSRSPDRSSALDPL